MLLHSRHIFTELGEIDGVIEIENGRIVRIAEGDADGARDLGELTVIPGIFDTHNHGTQGYSLLDGEDKVFVGGLRGYMRGAASEGVTLIFPTFFSSTGVGPRTLELVALAAREADEKPCGARIGGLHFEGPFLNRVGEHGVRPEPLEIDLEFVRNTIRAANGKLRLMGVAPELPHSSELIHILTENGVAAAITHSDCDSTAARAAYDEGVTVATHLFNVMTGLHHRNVGGAGAAILDDRVFCEIICDGLHVCNDMLKILFMLKPTEKIMMISDCTGYSGAPAGTYKGFLRHSGTVIVDEQGFVREPGGRLRGSSKPVIYGIKNLVRNVGIPMEQALRCAALNPCVKYGWADRKGSLSVGKDADFVIIDSDFNVRETWLEGEKIYDCAEKNGIFNKETLNCLVRD